MERQPVVAAAVLGVAVGLGVAGVAIGGAPRDALAFSAPRIDERTEDRAGRVARKPRCSARAAVTVRTRDVPAVRKHMERTGELVPRGVMLVGGADRAGAQDVQYAWDKDLAFEWDRAHYEKLLQEMIRTSEAEVSSWLGWQRTRPLRIEVVTKARYEASYGSGMAWNTGAFYRQGVIHVNGGARLDGWFAGMLSHEMTHAFLDDLGTGPRIPSWLNEGLAERIAYRTRGQHGLTTTQVQQLEVALEQKKLLPLVAGGAMTSFRYLQGFAAVLFLEKKIGKDALLAVVRHTMRQGTFEQALDAELRWTMKDVESGFSYWVDHLQ